MSVFTWGKIKFDSKPQHLKNFEQEKIWVMFDLAEDESQGIGLHVSELEENEIYFDMLCDYHKYEGQNVNPLDYSNNDDFLMRDIERECEKEYEERISKIQRVLKTLLNILGVQEISFFNTEAGECSIEDYEQVEWNINEFALRFVKRAADNNWFPPTIKVVLRG